MKKLEIIYRYILDQAIEKKQFSFTQLALAKLFSFSLSTVNNAIIALENIGAIIIKQRSFELVDIKKILYYWATIRKFNKDIIYQTRKEDNISNLEKLVPANAIFTAFSSYKFRFKDVPADYSELYFYIADNELDEVKKRFSAKKGPPNIIVLKADEWLLKTKNHTVSATQLFVDLWNIKQWYAQEFLKKLEERLLKE